MKNKAMYGLNELREMFLSFFEEKGHLRLPSFPLIPKDDPSLLLINSGMAPMKPWFTGELKPPRQRVCTCQKCIRTGDIENVGKTSRHGTYFEMLGNFSFGDYFKSEAIAWCWEFLTERIGLNPDDLYPSVYQDDKEAFDIWAKDIGIAPERIAKLGKEDNFWEQGSGPCGPCSEVYYDRGPANGCGLPGCAPGCDCDRYIEIWNNVFTQYDNDGEGKYTELSQKNIDTGMGLERLACVCQGVSNMFEVDTIMSIINKVSEISNVTYGQDGSSDISIRVIADHIRSATMMICDGILPSNEGRGYVLRRLLRRAARHGRLLGVEGQFLNDICGAVIKENKEAYRDLIDKEDYINRIVRIEEENFGKTIDSGTAKLTGLIKEYGSRGEKTLSGADAFKLYDTYGYPLDLTVEILAEHGYKVDIGSFDEHMQEQRMRARKAREALGDLAWSGVDLGLDNTPSLFTDSEESISSVLAIVAREELSSSLHEGAEGIIVLDKTPFYAEAGGQSSDCGKLISEKNAVFAVEGVKLKSGKYLHYGKMLEGTISLDDTVTAAIDTKRRRAIMRAHSSTHLLHKALHTVIGEHAKQAGSLVEPDKLRFDFTHFSALTREELTEIERRVNEAILEGYPVSVEEMPMSKAKEIGAEALFGEKYGDVVRVVNMGNGFSVELCGGTHLENTAKAGAFNITAEFSVASGVRRIEATTGMATLEAMKCAQEQLGRLAGIVKAGAPDEIFDKFEQNMATFRELRIKLDAALMKESRGEASRILSATSDIGGLKVIATIFEDTDADVEKLRQIEDTLRDMETGIVAVLAAVKCDKITILAACGKKAVARGIKAGEIIREVTRICGGSGGGKPEFAMGGGKDPAKLREALEAVERIVRSKVEA